MGGLHLAITMHGIFGLGSLEMEPRVACDALSLLICELWAASRLRHSLVCPIC